MKLLKHEKALEVLKQLCVGNGNNLTDEEKQHLWLIYEIVKTTEEMVYSYDSVRVLELLGVKLEQTELEE